MTVLFPRASEETLACRYGNVTNSMQATRLSVRLNYHRSHLALSNSVAEDRSARLPTCQTTRLHKSPVPPAGLKINLA